jgi:hypothetical protein
VKPIGLGSPVPQRRRVQTVDPRQESRKQADPHEKEEGLQEMLAFLKSLAD